MNKLGNETMCSRDSVEINKILRCPNGHRVHGKWDQTALQTREMTFYLTAESPLLEVSLRGVGL